MKNFKKIAALTMAASLAACGGDGGGSIVASTGIFLDSAVAGIGYRTPTQSGVTNTKGEYSFIPGEKVTFFIGSIEFPPVIAKGTVTPLDIAQTTDINNQLVSNILVLLQSLDEDGNPNNGITIPSAAASRATSAVNFDVSPLAFSSNTSVIGLVANSGSINKSLVSQSSAIENFKNTLNSLDIPYNSAPTFKPNASIVTPEPSSGNCPQGGSKIQSGIDNNSNGALDSDEVTNTSYVCNGATGSAGKNALTNVSSEPAGSNCASGGSRIQAGVDLNGNGILENNEVTSNSFICHGATGPTGPAGATGASGFNSLVKVTPEPVGENCASGGNKIQTGLDTNRDGVLGSDEVSSTQFTCNGTFPLSYDITPPTITTTAPLVATGHKTTFTTTYTDDTELAFARKSDGTVLWFDSEMKSLKIDDSVNIPLGSSLTRSYWAVDIAGNVAKKTITMTTPATAMMFGVYMPVTDYSLPAGFNCSYTNAYPYYMGVKDGTALSYAYLNDSYTGYYSAFGNQFNYTGWTTLNGYAPMISTNFLANDGENSFTGQSLKLTPLNANSFSFESGDSSISGSSGTGFFSIETRYAGTVTQTDPTTVNVSVSMKCNINNTGFITGTPAIFDLKYSAIPIAFAGSNQIVSKGNVVNLYGYANTNTKIPTITYSWTLNSKPAGSQAALSSATTENPTFTADVVGTYVVSLVVNDGTANSAASTVTVTAQ